MATTLAMDIQLHHKPDLAQEGSGTHLETAHQRMLTYLKALHVPVRARYELTARALELAEKSCLPEDRFISAAMQHLNDLLQESQPQRFLREIETLEPMPPLNRGAMVPVIIDRSGPFAFIFGALARAVVKLCTPPIRIYMLLAILATLLALYGLAFFK